MPNQLIKVMKTFAPNWKLPNQLRMLGYRYKQAFSIDWAFFRFLAVFVKFLETFEKYPINRECLPTSICKHSQLIGLKHIFWWFWHFSCKHSLLIGHFSNFDTFWRNFLETFEKYPINRECLIITLCKHSKLIGQISNFCPFLSNFNLGKLT